MVITCLDSVLAVWQEKIKFSQKLEADLSLPWWESMTKLNWAGFCFLLVNVAHNRNFYSTCKCSWKCNPTKRNLWERWKGRLHFVTKDPELHNKWRETLQHPEDFRNAQKLRKQKGIWIISACHWFSWFTSCFQNYSNFRAISINRMYWFQSLSLLEKLKNMCEVF